MSQPIDEQTVTSPLLMDRTGTLGNSEDVFLRRALHTKVGNKPTEPVPIYIVVQPGNTFFADGENNTDPDQDVSLLSGTLDEETLFSKLLVSCRIESFIALKVDGITVATLRTGAATPNASFSWEPKRTFPAGAQYELTIKARAESPISSCEAHLMGTQIIT